LKGGRAAWLGILRPRPAGRKETRKIAQAMAGFRGAMLAIAGCQAGALCGRSGLPIVPS
jgi:hypothetical protein